MNEPDESLDKELDYLLRFLDEMGDFNNLNFFSDKRNHLHNINPNILDYIEEMYNYMPSHMREKFHRLAIITMYLLGAGKDPKRKADFVRVSRKCIDEVRASPQWLNFNRIRELDPHFADLLELAKENAMSLTKSLNKIQPIERYQIDPGDMWELVEIPAKAYWIEIKKKKNIQES